MLMKSARGPGALGPGQGGHPAICRTLWHPYPTGLVAHSLCLTPVAFASHRTATTELEKKD